VDYGQAEAIKLQGKDPRNFSVMTQKFEGDSDGNLVAIHTVEVEWVDNGSGGKMPKAVEGTEKRVEAELVLLAMGFLGPEDPVAEQLGIDRDGDSRRGQSLVVWAINEGRGCAREVDKYLMGDTVLP
jgi:glutamate synthase (NADPH/NADH) small chain